LNNAFQKYIADEPIFVYEAATHSDSALGNRFGNYFEVFTFFFFVNYFIDNIP